MKCLKFLFFMFIISGCSTLLESKTLVTGLASFLGCSAIGAIVSPEEIRTEYSAGFLGFGCAAGSMAAVEYYETIKGKNREKEMLNTLRGKDFQNEVSIRKSLLQSQGFKNLDPKTKEKLKGNWSIYKTNNWILNEGKVFHEDLEINFTD